MPKTIKCWDCLGKGHNLSFEGKKVESPTCPLCKGGEVISVYTQEEVDKAVETESEIWERAIMILETSFMMDIRRRIDEIRGEK